MLLLQLLRLRLGHVIRQDLSKRLSALKTSQTHRVRPKLKTGVSLDPMSLLTDNTYHEFVLQRASAVDGEGTLLLEDIVNLVA